VTRGLSLATRLGSLLAVMLVVGCGLAASLNYLKFERILLEQQARVLEILVEEISNTVENGLALGVPLAGVPGAQALLERSRAAEPLIANLSIVDPGGIVLFDTDRQNLHAPAPPAALERRSDTDTWRFRNTARYGIGVPITNNFGQSEGAILLTYERHSVDERLASALLSMVQATLLALAVALPAGAIGMHLITRPTRRWFAAMEAAMQPGARPEPLAAALQDAIGEANAVLDAAERRLEAIAAEMPEEMRS
jgi:hypothetical protein